MPHDNLNPTPQRRSLLARLRPRFSLRTMLAVITVVCLFLPWIIRSERQRRPANQIEREFNGQLKLVSESDPTFPKSNEKYSTRFDPTEHSWEQHYLSSIDAIRCDNFLDRFTDWKELSQLESLQTTVTFPNQTLGLLLRPLQQCPRLKTLRLEIDGYGTTGEEDLESISKLRSLENLQIQIHSSYNEKFFFCVKKLENLKSVDFEGEMTSQMLEQLAECPKLERLRFVTHRSARFEISLLGKFRSLKELEMISHNTDDESLAQLKHLTTLKKLKLGRDIIHRGAFTDQSLEPLRELKNLRELTLVGATIFDDGLRNLEYLDELRTLRFQHCVILKNGFVELCNLTQLKSLSLPGYNIVDDHLNEIGTMTHLEYVNLRPNSKITEAGIEKLMDLAKHTKIDFDESRISRELCKKIKAAYESNHIKRPTVD